ncbi:hypothetical protein DL93DRAFT_2167332 [Clavulina sp. PMI_390]|nr:hypothetical protein DL93DRAFT_2167332 [Clavulina sp. PMI_390]
MAPLSTVPLQTSTAVPVDKSSVWTKPKTAGYKIKELLEFPKRIINPPPANLPMLATVGSLSLRPSYEVKIEDMLDAKYLPPVGLRDFEEWLLFKEHSAENLYFIQWLRDYRKSYNSPQYNDTQLWFSFLRAKGSFFTSEGSLELNLPHQIIRDVAAITFSSAASKDAATTPPTIYLTPPPSASPSTSEKFSNHQSINPTVNLAPSPDRLKAAEEHVMRLLQVSLQKFAAEAICNAGVVRRFYCTSVGVSAVLAGMIPVLISICRGYSRYIRLVGFPFFWLGFIVMFCAYCRICLVIYFWGDFRQLRGYELDMPSIVPTIVDVKEVIESPNTYPPSPSSPNTIITIRPPGLGGDDDHDSEDGQVVGYRSDLEAGNGVPDSPTIVLSLPPRSPVSNRDGEQAPPTDPPSPRPRQAPPVPLNIPRSPAGAYGWDWDAPQVTSSRASMHSDTTKFSLSSVIYASSTRSGVSTLAQMGRVITPIFAPLTKVVNPLIVRGMAEVVRRSSLWGFMFAVILQAIVFVVPFQGHGWGYGW